MKSNTEHFQNWKSHIAPHYLDVFIEPLMNRALAEIEPTQPQTPRLLDFGCGTGEKANAFSKIGFETTGLDINPDYIAHAQKNFPGTEFICHDGHELPFEDESFDVFHSFSVLQYLDQQAVMHEVLRVLKPGGKAIFIENLRDNWITKTYRTVHRLAGWKYTDFQTPRRHLAWNDLPELGRGFGRFEFSAKHIFTPLSLVPSEIKSRVLQGSGCFYPPNALIFNTLQKMDDFFLRDGKRQGGCWFVLILGEK